MTTSNHRPYDFPAGKIDLPSHTSGRRGAVKYTDFAIGEFLRKAKSKPWYPNTLFVIVADHCASSAGKTSLPIENYEIPLIIYNPNLVAPRKIDTLCSQIDYAPTLLGLMNWSYQSRFFGKDVLKMRPDDERAFIANYQALGLMKGGHLNVLKPLRKQETFAYDALSRTLVPMPSLDQSEIEDAIAYYQSAHYTFHHHLGREITRLPH